MKKLTIGLAVLLSGYAANSFAALPYGSSKFDVCVPSFCGGFTLGLTGLYWRPSAPHLDYALSYPAVATSFFPFAFTDGRYHSVDPDYDWGFKAEVGYVFPCTGNDINLTYTHYDQDDTDTHSGDPVLFPTLTDTFSDLSLVDFAFPATITLPAITLTLGGVTATIGAGVVLPVTGVISPATPIVASAKADFENRTWDLDFGQHINVGCNLRLRWFGGLRYSDLEHKLDVTYTATSTTPVLLAFDTAIGTVAATGTIPFAVTATVRDVVNQKSDFNGVGPRFGLDATYHLGGGFGVVGSLSTSLLIGEIDSTFTEEATFDSSAVIAGAVVSTPAGVVAALTGPAVATTVIDITSFKHPDETRIVPNIDAKLGLDYSYEFCNCAHTKLVIEAGWMVSHYFNSIDRLSEVGSDFPELRTRHTIDTSYDGPYVGIHVNI